MPTPRVSVLIPSYNHAAFIEHTVASVLKQTETNFELCIVDDGSSDDSWDILKKLAAQDARISLNQQNNKGKVATVNAMIKNSTAPYVCVLDSDDALLPERLAWALEDLDAHPQAPAVFCWAELIDSNNQVTSEKTLNFKMSQAHSPPLERLMLTSNRLCSATGVVRREALERVEQPFYPLIIYQDYDLWLRLLGYGPLFLREEVGAHYRIHKDNLSRIRETNKALHLEEAGSCLIKHAAGIIARHESCRDMFGAVHGRLGLFAYLLGDYNKAASHLATRAKFDKLSEEESLVFVAVLYNIGHREESKDYLLKLARQRDKMTPRGQSQLDELMMTCQVMVPRGKTSPSTQALAL